MPVLESTEKIAPRSALRHRPIDEGTQTRRPTTTTTAQPVTQRASRSRPQATDDEQISEWKRGDAEDPAPTPTRKTTVPVQGSSGNTRKTVGTPINTLVKRASRTRAHPLLFLGLGMLAMLILWTLLLAGFNWWNNAMDNLHYGYPRTFQADAPVGHSDSVSSPSHFIAINLHGKLEIIEFPGGDATHARVYLGPQLFGPDTDKVPVTLRFADVNGDHQPDMLVLFQSSWIVFINDKGGFRPPTEQEHQDAAQYLATHGQ